jgi:hypothetical protein
MQKFQDAELEDKIKKLREDVRDTTNWDHDLEDLLSIIHRPGWTTPAESTFVGGIIDAISTQFRAMKVLRETLMKGSRSVGRT